MKQTLYQSLEAEWDVASKGGGKRFSGWRDGLCKGPGAERCM